MIDRAARVAIAALHLLVPSEPFDVFPDDEDLPSQKAVEPSHPIINRASGWKLPSACTMLTAATVMGGAYYCLSLFPTVGADLIFSNATTVITNATNFALVAEAPQTTSTAVSTLGDLGLIATGLMNTVLPLAALARDARKQYALPRLAEDQRDFLSIEEIDDDLNLEDADDASADGLGGSADAPAPEPEDRSLPPSDPLDDLHADGVGNPPPDAPSGISNIGKCLLGLAVVGGGYAILPPRMREKVKDAVFNPKDTLVGLVTQGDKKTYTRLVIVCANGVRFENVTFNGWEGLSQVEQNAEFDLIAKQLAKIPKDQLVMGKEITVSVEEAYDTLMFTRDATEKERAEGGPPKISQPIPLPTNPKEKAEVQTMIEGLRGAKNKQFLNDLRSTKIEATPFNQPMALPIGSKGGPDSLHAALHVMLSVDQMRHDMMGCANKELRDIATAYDQYLKKGTGNAIDLTDLQKSLAPFFGNSPGLKVSLDDQNNQTFDNYSKSLLHLMGNGLNVKHSTFITGLYLDGAIRLIGGQEEKWRNATAQFPTVNVNAPDRPKSLQEVFNDALGCFVRGYCQDMIMFEEAPPIMLLHFQDSIPDLTASSVTLTMKRGHIYPAAKGKNINYNVHSFSVNQITYLTTVEKVEGEERPFYWKIEGDKVENIAEKDYLEAMTKAKGGLILVREGERHLDREERFYSPIRVQGNVSFERGDINARENPHDLADPNDPHANPNFKRKFTTPEILKERVPAVLNHAYVPNARPQTITLPVPKGEDGSPYWPMGVMWFAAQDYMKAHPQHFEKIKLVMDDWEIDQDLLIRMIDKAENYYLSPETEPDRNKAFEAFMITWGSDWYRARTRG